MDWLVPRNELTHHQLGIVDLPVQRHVVVLGPPGSGKTLALLHRAKYLIDSHEGTPDDYRIFVYTNVLKDYIRSAAELLGIPNNNILTFDDWCCTFHEENIGRLPWGKGGPDFARVRRQVRSNLKRTEAKKPFKFLLVDEGQDLDEAAYSIANYLSGHVTVFGDDNQQLYREGIGIERIKQALGGSRRVKTVHLADAFRCSPYVARMASNFLESDEEKQAFLLQHPLVYSGERQKPLLKIVKNREAEIEELFRNLQVRLGLNERIAILFPTRKLAFGYAQNLNDRGLEVEVPVQRGSSRERLTIDFSTPRPKAMAYPSAKGLTFDSVFLPLFDRERFRFIYSEEQLRKWVFVVISRAVKWIYISSIRDKVMFFEEFRQLEYEGQLTVRRHWFEDDESDDEPTSSVKPASEFDDMF